MRWRKEWGAAKGYLKIENRRPARWIVDPNGPDESAGSRPPARPFRSLTDANGLVLYDSETYRSIGIDPPAEIHRVLSLPRYEIHIRSDELGIPT